MKGLSYEYFRDGIAMYSNGRGFIALITCLDLSESDPTTYRFALLCSMTYFQCQRLVQYRQMVQDLPLRLVSDNIQESVRFVLRPPLTSPDQGDIVHTFVMLVVTNTR